MSRELHLGARIRGPSSDGQPHGWWANTSGHSMSELLRCDSGVWYYFNIAGSNPGELGTRDHVVFETMPQLESNERVRSFRFGLVPIQYTGITVAPQGNAIGGTVCIVVTGGLELEECIISYDSYVASFSSQVVGWDSQGNFRDASYFNNLELGYYISPDTAPGPLRWGIDCIFLQVQTRTRPEISTFQVSETQGGSPTSIIQNTTRPWLEIAYNYGIFQVTESVTVRTRLFNLGDTTLDSFNPWTSNDYLFERESSAEMWGQTRSETFRIDQSLPVGEYVAYSEIVSYGWPGGSWSSEESIIRFEVDYPMPNSPIVDVEADYTNQRVCLEIYQPEVSGSVEWDNPSNVVVEVQRAEAYGTYIEPPIDGNGSFVSPGETITVCDRMAPRSRCIDGCGDISGSVHSLQYRVRFYGQVNEQDVRTPWTVVPNCSPNQFVNVYGDETSYVQADNTDSTFPITGTLTSKALIRTLDWRQRATIVGKWDGTGSNRSYRFVIWDRFLRVEYIDTNNNNVRTLTSDEELPTSVMEWIWVAVKSTTQTTAEFFWYEACESNPPDDLDQWNKLGRTITGPTVTPRQLSRGWKLGILDHELGVSLDIAAAYIYGSDWTDSFQTNNLIPSPDDALLPNNSWNTYGEGFTNEVVTDLNHPHGDAAIKVSAPEKEEEEEEEEETYLYLPGDTESYISTVGPGPNAGDQSLDVRVLVEPDDWTRDQMAASMWGYEPSSSQPSLSDRVWAARLWTDNQLYWVWRSVDGMEAARASTTFTPADRLWVRWVKEGSDVRFLTSLDGSTWGAYGTHPTNNTAPFHEADVPLIIGGQTSYAPAFHGRVMRAQVLIGGQMAADLDMNQWEYGETSYTDPYGNTFQLHGNATVEGLTDPDAAINGGSRLSHQFGFSGGEEITVSAWVYPARDTIRFLGRGLGSNWLNVGINVTPRVWQRVSYTTIVPDDRDLTEFYIQPCVRDYRTNWEYGEWGAFCAPQVERGTLSNWVPNQLIAPSNPMVPDFRSSGGMWDLCNGGSGTGSREDANGYNWNISSNAYITCDENGYEDPEDISQLILCSDGQSWLRHLTDEALDIPINVDSDWEVSRNFNVFRPVSGGLPTIGSSAPGGRDTDLTLTAKNSPELKSITRLIDGLSVYYDPSDEWLSSSWLAVNDYSVSELKAQGRYNLGGMYEVQVKGVETKSPFIPIFGRDAIGGTVATGRWSTIIETSITGITNFYFDPIYSLIKITMFGTMTISPGMPLIIPNHGEVSQNDFMTHGISWTSSGSNDETWNDYESYWRPGRVSINAGTIEMTIFNAQGSQSTSPSNQWRFTGRSYHRMARNFRTALTSGSSLTSKGPIHSLRFTYLSTYGNIGNFDILVEGHG